MRHGSGDGVVTEAASDSRIMRQLLAGAVPVCIDCGRDLAAGEPRVTVRLEPVVNAATLVRCCDCEYRRLHG